MANLIVQNDAPAFGSVFLPIQIDFRWEFPSCFVYNASTFLGIRVDVSFTSDIENGDFVQILNGSYKGTYKVTSLTYDASYVYIVTDGVFVSSDSLSNRFNLDRRQTFEIYGGFQSGAGSTVKPYEKLADVSVPINPNTLLFEVPLSPYLRSYFEIAPPLVGKDYALSLPYDIVYPQAAPTEQTINWVLTEQPSPFCDANVIIRKNGVDIVAQYSSGSGSFTALSGDTIQAYALGFSADYNQSLNNNLRLTVEDSDTVVLIEETKNITNYVPTIVGETIFSFSVVRDRDYDITVESFTI
jgi:hypothetical protein